MMTYRHQSHEMGPEPAAPTPASEAARLAYELRSVRHDLRQLQGIARELSVSLQGWADTALAIGRQEDAGRRDAAAQMLAARMSQRASSLSAAGGRGVDKEETP